MIRDAATRDGSPLRITVAILPDDRFRIVADHFAVATVTKGVDEGSSWAIESGVGQPTDEKTYRTSSGRLGLGLAARWHSDLHILALDRYGLRDHTHARPFGINNGGTVHPPDWHGNEQGDCRLTEDKKHMVH